VAESEEVRSACVRLSGLISEAFVKLEMRKDVYEKLVQYEKEVTKNKHYLTRELRRCLSHLILKGRRNGISSRILVDKLFGSIDVVSPFHVMLQALS